jgi:uncharacterized flavoprotein (TIGR03862 family)
MPAESKIHLICTGRGQNYNWNQPMGNTIVDALIVGAGPSGLMAATQLAEAGKVIAVFDAMPSFGRKFLRAGVGGLNITHSEPSASFLGRYLPQSPVADWLQAFDADSVVAWAAGLGVETFVGSSGRVFPVQLKASPLLRAWLGQLHQRHVSFFTRHRWLGWEVFCDEQGQSLQRHRFITPAGEVLVDARCSVLALGGGSWSRLGSDGQWMQILHAKQLHSSPLTASNCGFDVGWSEHIQQNFAGAPLKSVSLGIKDVATGQWLFNRRGEAMLSKHGIQGSLIYAASRTINHLLGSTGPATLYWDLLPDMTEQTILARLSGPRGKESRSNFLRKRLGISGLKMAMLNEFAKDALDSPHQLAALLKALPMTVNRARPLDEAISTTGGLCFSEVDAGLMLKKYPGVFCAGEMLDWDAPTGGYLLTACLASGYCAGNAACNYVDQQQTEA